MNLITNWFRRHFSDPQVVILAVFLIIGSAVVLFFGKMLAPVLASVVIAYLLQGPVGALERRRVPRLVAVLLYHPIEGLAGPRGRRRARLPPVCCV